MNPSKRRQLSRESREPWTPMRPAVDLRTGSHIVTLAGDTFAVFKNHRYTVLVRKEQPAEGWPQMIHMSIKRNDRKPIFDWREIQLIKNEIVGPENEGVQLFPAESRLVDSANQYHLYVCEDSEIRFPFGYNERLVDDKTKVGNSVQRPFEKSGDDNS